MTNQKAADHPGPVAEISQLPVITARLQLQPINENYAQEIFQEFTPEIARYMYPRPPDKIADTLQFIHTSQNQLQAGTDFVTVILRRDTGEFLGCTGIHNIHTRTPKFGIWLKKSAHGQKYGPEAIQGLKNWADQNLDYDYLIYPVDQDNLASRKIPESMGGRLVGTDPKINLSGNPLNTVVYHIPHP